jgi:hypothetical protein
MSRSAVRVRSSALFFVAICRENSGSQWSLDAKADANLLQPAEEMLLVEWRQDDTEYIAFDGKAWMLWIARARSGILHLDKRRIGEGPHKSQQFLPSSFGPSDPSRHHVGAVSSVRVRSAAPRPTPTTSKSQILPHTYEIRSIDFRVFPKWVMLGSNQRLLSCDGELSSSPASTAGHNTAWVSRFGVECTKVDSPASACTGVLVVLKTVK